MKNILAAIAFVSVGILGFAPSIVHAAELKIQGAPGSIAALKKKQSALESASGSKLSLHVQNPAITMDALSKGLVDGVALGGEAKDFFEEPELKDGKYKHVDDYEWITFGHTTIMAVLHPDNPVQALTKKEIAEILSGKIKTWESINGRKDPIRIVLNKSQPATLRAVPRFFIGEESLPGAEYVTTLRGVAEKIKEQPGTLSFSGSKFEEASIHLKFVETGAHIPYVLGAKKPISPEMRKVFDALK